METVEQKIRILLIEDDPEDTLLLELLLKKRGEPFQTTVAKNLKTATHELTQGTFDIVLLDLGLPDCQGLQSAEKIKAATPSLPIVVLTGLEDDLIAAKALREGVQDYLTKGHFDSEILTRSIRYAIERKHVEQELVQKTQELERSNKDLEQFAYFISHDLKIPLYRIISFVDRLKEAHQEGLDPSGKDSLDHLRNVALDMEKLMNELLKTFATSESSKES